MTGQFMGLLVEGAVAALLVVTIAYCFVLNRKLGALKSDQHALKSTVLALNSAIEQANVVTADLRKLAGAAETELAARIDQAEGCTSHLEQSLGVATEVLAKICAISQAAKAPHAANALAGRGGRVARAKLAAAQSAALRSPQSDQAERAA